MGALHSIESDRHWRVFTKLEPRKVRIVRDLQSNNQAVTSLYKTSGQDCACFAH